MDERRLLSGMFLPSMELVAVHNPQRQKGTMHLDCKARTGDETGQRPGCRTEARLQRRPAGRVQLGTLS